MVLNNWHLSKNIILEALTSSHLQPPEPKSKRGPISHLFPKNHVFSSLEMSATFLKPFTILSNWLVVQFNVNILNTIEIVPHLAINCNLINSKWDQKLTMVVFPSGPGSWWSVNIRGGTCVSENRDCEPNPMLRLVSRMVYESRHLVALKQTDGVDINSNCHN